MEGIWEKRCLCASLILIMMDDFTDKNITDSPLLVRAEGGSLPIKKENGTYIFMNMPEGRTEITVEGHYYRKKRMEVDIKKDQGAAVHQVRLTPNRSYPIPENTCCLEGRAAPGECLLFFRSNEPKPMKLLKNYEKEPFIEIFTQGAPAEYRMLYLEEKGGNGEFFEVEEAQGQRYRLKEPLGSSYKKIGTKIYPVYAVTADEQGDFFLPVSGRSAGTLEMVLTAEDGKRSVFTVQAGRLNRLDPGGPAQAGNCGSGQQ